MATSGYATGGASGTGPSTSFLSLPYRGYRELAQWFEEFADAMGLPLDILYQRFIKPASRANLLDPTYTPTDVADANFATATSAPTAALSKDTMLDVLAFIALGQYPLDTNMSVAQKQELVQVGWTALKRKGTRQQILNLASKMTDGVCVGWTTPPFNFSIIVPDGEPSPGYGSWVQPLSANSETSRPWILSAVRNTLTKGMFPDWSNLGVGYSQFRWGYSSWGETYFPVGARINIFAHEHFDAWAAGLPTGWTQVGTGAITQSTSDPSINWEFTGGAAVLDLTGLSNGTVAGLSQTTVAVNNQIAHRFQLDYKYTNSQGVGVLCVQITDANDDGNTYYWNPDTATWSTTAYNIVVNPSESRGRYACDVVMQAASTTAGTRGTKSVTATVFAKSDGTATTQTTYTIYRVGLYEKFDLDIELEALGERTLWLPLVDSPGWSTCTRTGTTNLIEFANAERTEYKYVAAGKGSFPYHPAISGRGYQSHFTWTNSLKGSNDFGADWTLTNATIATGAEISPLVGETVPSAPTLTATNTGASISQSSLGTPTNRNYVGGIWVKKLSSDSNFTDVTISMISTSTKFQTFTVTQAEGWKLLPFNFAFGAGDVASVSFRVSWGAASSNGQIAVANAYCNQLNQAFAGVLYPPVIQTPVGSTASSSASKCIAITETTDTNVLHPLFQRPMVSVVRGGLGITVVSMFDARSVPDGVIFDVAQGASQNRVVLQVASGILELRRYDDAGNTWVAQLTLTRNPSPAAGQVTWQRDTAIVIRALWDENSTTLSAGNGNASGTKPGSWGPLDTSVAKLRIGNSLSGSPSFNGITSLGEVIQLGAPAL